MQTTNPLPGMNPYLEASWAGVHTRLIALIADALTDQLPNDLRADAEEDVLIGHEEPFQQYRADVGITQVWPPSLPEVSEVSSSQSVSVAAPVILEIDRLPHRWVEIRDVEGRLITAIEVLSPSNKRSDGRDIYLQKQSDLLHAGVNLVEIDLIRGGKPVCDYEVMEKLRKSDDTQYLVLVTRAQRPNRREVYYCPLRETLPTIRIPLRTTDKDVLLPLQPLINHVYEKGRHWQLCHKPLPTPALSAEDAEWMEERLREAGLR